MRSKLIAVGFLLATVLASAQMPVSGAGSSGSGKLNPNLTTVCEGDSLMAGSGVSAGQDICSQMMLLPQFVGRGGKYNFATGGNKVADLVARYAANVKPLCQTGTAILFVWIGYNDVEAGTAAATIYTALASYWATAKADGCKIAAFTVHYGGHFGDATKAPITAALNAAIKNAAGTTYDYLVDAAEFFTDPTDSTLMQSDNAPFNIHPNATGAAALAKYINFAVATSGDYVKQQPTAIQPVTFLPFSSGERFEEAAANVVMLHHGLSTGQTLRVHYYFDPATPANWSGIKLSTTNSTDDYIYAACNGATTCHNLVLGTQGAFPLNFMTNNSIVAFFNATGSLGWQSDGGGNIGGAGAARPGNIYAKLLINAGSYGTATNCAVNSVSPAACGSAAAGAVVIPTTTTTYTVNTSAVTANSVITITPRTYAGALPSSPTCVTPAVTSSWNVSAISAGASFTITLPSTTGSTCWNYVIMN